MADDTTMQDAHAVAEDELQYGHGVMTEDELNEKYPHRPRNQHKTLRFSDLFTTLFNPLNENRKKPSGPVISRKKIGPHGGSAQNMSPNEIRRTLIERFISRWRKEVGNDIYPAFRLITPDKDRERAMYGLKEKTIAKILVKVLRIDEHSEDGFNLLNWKLPGQQAAVAMAGDFAGRCYDVVAKRPFGDRTTPGSMTVAEVNERLDTLSMMSKEEEQMDIFKQFYRRMNAEEIMWLIRIILRQMKVGATEKTFLDIWHPDAENLFNVSSSLRRICWELYDPNVRLDRESSGIALMQCFQPQLAAFQMHSLEKIVAKMRPSETDEVFWIEEKLDGERMQLHMFENEDMLNGKEFRFWSRKAKDYTYLYGNSFEDDNSALTRHIKKAFKDDVRNIILDGEMITWDDQEKAMVPFGTLKTAAILQQANPFSAGQRPLYRVFDCLYLNDTPLTDYTLRDRRAALDASIESVDGRLEIHKYTEALNAADIEKSLRVVVSESSEGLVVKNPRSKYKLNDRNDDWIKVKPEYMTEFGEALDCVIVGGYYGSGSRGGKLSSYLCGLLVDDDLISRGANPQLCYSFFKVGGGMSAADYAQIRHHTDGKWVKFDIKNQPKEYLLLAGPEKQPYEKPDVWIKPAESVVVSVKAASVGPTDQFKMGVTLRFPRFKKLRLDKDWKSALSIKGFMELKNNAEQEKREKEFEVDDARRKKRVRTTRKKPINVVGSEETVSTPYAGPKTALFDGLTFFIVSESLTPRKSAAELKDLVKNNGGAIVLKEDAAENVICVTDRKNFKTASLLKHGTYNLVRPIWLLDCLAQHEIDMVTGRETLLLPMEPQHMFFTTDEDVAQIEHNVDQYGDSYARDCTVEDLRKLMEDRVMKTEDISEEMSMEFLEQMEERGLDLEELPGWMFLHVVVYLDTEEAAGQNGLSRNDGEQGGEVKSVFQNVELVLAGHIVAFAGGEVRQELSDSDITHVVVGKDKSRLKAIRAAVSSKPRIPRIVTEHWVGESWAEKTLLDEERFAPV